MNVLIIHNRFGRSALGGGESVVQKDRLKWMREGHRVVVLSSDCFHGFKSLVIHRDREDPDDVYRVAPLSFWCFIHLGRLPFPLRLVWHVIDLVNPFPAMMLWRWLREFHPDIVMTHNLTGLGFLIVVSIRKARRARTPLQWIHTLHDLQLLTPSGLVLLGREHVWSYCGSAARLYRAWMRRVFGNPTQINAPSRWIIHEHRQYGFFRRSSVAIAPLPLIQKQKKTLIPSDRLHLLFIGQLEYHKGIFFLLETLEEYRGKMPPFRLDVIGQGSLYGAARRRRWPYDVAFHGSKPEREVQGFLNAAGVLIVPSLCYENAPQAIIEALETGTLVIASRIGGIQELVRDGEDGLLVAPGDGKELVAAIRRIPLLVK